MAQTIADSEPPRSINLLRSSGGNRPKEILERLRNVRNANAGKSL
jgi:hypothetical protein